MVMGRSKRARGVSLDLRKCDRHQVDVKGIKHECQLIERCDDVMIMGEVLGGVGRRDSDQLCNIGPF